MELTAPNVACKPEPELSYELKKCESSLARLENKINGLSQVLKPILRGETPINPSDCPKESEPKTLVGKNIRALSFKIEKMTDFIDDLTNRLEI